MRAIINVLKHTMFYHTIALFISKFYHSIHACYNQSFEVYNDLLDHDLPYHSLVEFRTLQCYPFVPKLTSLLSIPYFTILILNSIFNDSIHACYIQSIEAYHVLPLFNSILYHSSHV